MSDCATKLTADPDRTGWGEGGDLWGHAQLTELQINGFKAVQVLVGESLLGGAAAGRVKGQQPP